MTRNSRSLLKTTAGIATLARAEEYWRTLHITWRGLRVFWRVLRERMSSEFAG